MTVYTLGLWHVRVGQEADFVTAWQQLASATKATFPEASAVLLEDRHDPGLYISFGPWESQSRVEEWRSSAAFERGVAAVRPHLESFDPHTMNVVVTVD